MYEQIIENAADNPELAVDLVGKSLGKYRMQRRLSRGTTAAVYLARDEFVDRPVAIKLATLQSLGAESDTEVYRAMFFDQARAAGILRHPTITTIYDAGCNDEYCYIVMEYISGERSLSDYTHIENLLDLATASKVLYQCAMALDYAHGRGVIHGALRAGNILLTSEFDAKITGFTFTQAAPSECDVNSGDAGSCSSQSPPIGRRARRFARARYFCIGEHRL